MIPTNCRVTLHDLAEMPLFRYVAPESVDGVLSRCTVLELRKNDLLMRQGDSNRNLYLVLSGELGIRLDTPDSEPIALLGRGETIGEMSLIDHKGASAWVVASEDSSLLVFDEGSIWSLVRSSHAAACNLLEIITSRLRNANVALAERMRLQHDFHHYGSMDALTGLHNRHWLNHSLPRLIKRHQRSGEPLTMIMTDIDLFRDFNTDHGHLCGDHVIHTVARVFTEHLRPSEMAARYGGDEFVILMPGVNLENAAHAAQRLQQILADTTIATPSGKPAPPPTVSIGIAQYQNGQNANQFIANADAALYRAKELGRNNVAF